IPVDSNKNDLRDRSGAWPDPINPGLPSTLLRTGSYDQILLFEAVNAIRRSSAFADASVLKKVRVAIVDTGFDPKVPSEFSRGGSCPGGVVSAYKELVGNHLVSHACRDLGDHGTDVAGIIGALNDDSPFSGVFGSLFRRDEVTTAVSKLEITVYGCEPRGGRALDDKCIDLALAEIEGGAFQIVNLSFGADVFSTAGISSERFFYRAHFQAVEGRTLFVAAAGNEG